MDRTHPTRDTPRSLTAELTRYAGLNPHGWPMFRVVLAQNCREQAFGTMRHMPVLDPDTPEEMLHDLEPEAFTSGEMWLPRYDGQGWILERWFPAYAWGSQTDWEDAVAEDGTTRLRGEFPRHGDYFMVNDSFHAELQPAAFWKTEIQKNLREQESLINDPAKLLSLKLYRHRVHEAQREERFREEVEYAHRSVTDKMLATIGGAAQLVRDNARMESGWGGHIAAG